MLMNGLASDTTDSAESPKCAKRGKWGPGVAAAGVAGVSFESFGATSVLFGIAGLFPLGIAGTRRTGRHALIFGPFRGLKAFLERRLHAFGHSHHELVDIGGPSRLGRRRT
jgi:hypothetical protein